MSGTTPSLLLAAMSDTDATATAGWRAWRSSVDIQRLTWPEMQILPLLNGPRLEAWLAGDSAAGILKGIVRRAWSEAQVRLGAAREVLDCLRDCGCDSATVVGALGMYLRLMPSTAIRPVLELRILIPRADLASAAAALERACWQARDPIPSGPWLDRRNYCLWNRNGTRLYLHWRLLRVPSGRIAGCEREFLSECRVVEAIGAQFRILSPSHALIEALGEREESVDALAWQADAALLCLGLAQEQAFDWPRWAKLAARYQPEVFVRLPELRAMGVNIPEMKAPNTRFASFQSRFELEAFREAWRRLAGNWARRFTAATGRH
jgi:hypothetical protein